MRASSRLAVLLLTLLLASAATHAQRAEVRASAPPHYAGVPIDLQVVVEGFAPGPEPTVDFDVGDGATAELVGISPNVSSSVQIVNGKVTRSESVRFVYRYQLVAARPGAVQVGPFHIEQDNTTARARAVRFEIEAVPTTDAQRFRLVLPDGPLWVGQQVPVKHEWWLTDALAERLAGRRAQVPLFDHLDRFAFEDKVNPDARSTLVVDTASGTLELPLTVDRGEWQGKRYLVGSVERMMVALKPGAVTIEPASIVTEVAMQFSTDLFGNRVPTSVRRLRVEDEPRTLEFKAPPAAGRPASFAGAVGRGFAIEASADRSVVQTGDPIRLTVEIRGDAALDTVSLPRLAASGLDPVDFNAPDRPVGGIVENGFKRFDVVLRVLHEGVREIPAIAFSWFDPDLARYETTASRPIAVSVRAATVVSAADVVRSGAEDSEPVGAGAASGADSALAAADSTSPSTRPAFALSGAELAIETRPAMLAREPVALYARPVAVAAMYALGLVALGAAFLARRRAAVDPVLRERRKAVESERRTVAQAAGVGDLAGALRRMAAMAPSLPHAEYDALLDECDNLAYAPHAGADAPIDAKLRARAIAVADTIVEGVR